MPVVDIIPSPT